MRNGKNSSFRNDFRRDSKNSKRKGYSPQKERETPEENKIIYNCNICGTEIQDIITALCYTDENTPAHFDCIIKNLAEKENLQEGQRVVYLGSGNFGIVKTNDEENKPNFKIIKKIEFEQRENIPDWRRQLVKIKISQN